MSLDSQYVGFEAVNPDDPEQALLPALHNIPIAGKSPMNWGVMISRPISKHLTEMAVVYAPALARFANADGFIHVDDLPQPSKKFARPIRGEQSVFNPAGQWVDPSEPEPDPVVIQDPASMTVPEREAQVERLRYMGYRVNEPEPATEGAQVVDTMDEPPEFDPSTHSVTAVNAHLRSLDPGSVEFGRIVHAERNGKARNGILKRLP